jgi:LmbE family N-acetylglucosaminyl deacetylase
MIEQFRKVLVLGAHPDDESACSGTIARLVEAGAAVDLLTFSECTDFYQPELIMGEWRDAGRILGFHQMRNLNVPNRLFPTYRQMILSELDALRGEYDLVLCPSSSDQHQDHRQVHDEAARVFKHTTLLGYEHAMNTVHSSAWQCFVSLEEQHVEAKLAHARAYGSQQHRLYMAEEYLRGLLAVHGVQAGVRAAEAFEVVRWIA